MEKIAFLEMFPCCAGIGGSYGNLEDTYVLAATVRRETVTMTVQALFPAMPAPAELDALQWQLARE